MKTSFLSSSKVRMTSVIACLGLIVAFASCSKKYDPVPEPVGDLEILAVNTVSGSADQDLLINGVAKITGVSYGEATAYVKVTSGNSTLGFYNTGTTATANAGLQSGLPIGAKAAMYYYKLGGGELRAGLIDNATTNPATGKAKVRFLHLNNFMVTGAETSIPIAISIDGGTGTLIPSLSFANLSVYQEVDPGSKFNFTATGVTAGAAFDGPILANKIYTIWIDGTSAANLTGHLVVQN
ncbi:DUF4397 domain-containing protein [Pedobacter nyackensis]|uniref:DUF4397 domain-containing protein n=1 Tax=Pedobacter nyackensis TaxID=475255 RepID=UPI0029315EFB|nr:DUF4397 domain-containing protein [Pedobacter nyackensis]